MAGKVGADGGAYASLLSSFNSMSRLDKHTRGQIFQVVGRGRICQLINAMLNAEALEKDEG